MSPLEVFAEAVGAAGPVAVRGGGTDWEVGGASVAGVREVRAPEGIVHLDPAEMTVRVRAGTTVADLREALAEASQDVALPERDAATVGGVLAVGRSDVARLGRGPVRDALLEARYVDDRGRLVKAGGPTVKNVSGYDLCRLLVGSLGTIGLLAEVVLRTCPRPEQRRWLAGDADPFGGLPALHRPGAVLWDGARTWVLLEGRSIDVDAHQARLEAAGFAVVAGPPVLPAQRRSVDPGELAGLGRDGGRFVAEVGVGIVHEEEAPKTRRSDERLVALHRRVKQVFDPAGRLNPGRSVLAP